MDPPATEELNEIMPNSPQPTPILYTEQRCSEQTYQEPCIPSPHKTHQPPFPLHQAGSQSRESDCQGDKWQSPTCGPSHKNTTNECDNTMEEGDWDYDEWLNDMSWMNKLG